MNARPLIVTLQSMIERSYGMPRVIEDVTPFLIGDAGYRERYRGRDGSAPADEVGARLLVRDSGATLRAALYYPDRLVRHLERHNPLLGLGDVNIEAFAVLVEELDHLLTVASRAAEGRPVSLLELEHHANVTKYLVVIHFLGRQTGRRRIADSLRWWTRHHVLGRYETGGATGQTRYRDAALLAGRYIRFFESLAPESRPAELRAYQRRPFSETFRLVSNPN